MDGTNEASSTGPGVPVRVKGGCRGVAERKGGALTNPQSHSPEAGAFTPAVERVSRIPPSPRAEPCGKISVTRWPQASGAGSSQAGHPPRKTRSCQLQLQAINVQIGKQVGEPLRGTAWLSVGVLWHLSQAGRGVVGLYGQNGGCTGPGIPEPSQNRELN